MATQIIAVSVAHPGTGEQHITAYKTETGNILSKESLISLIRFFDDQVFYTVGDWQTAYLMIAKTADGTEYVKTNPDSTTKNNLLSLPRF